MFGEDEVIKAHKGRANALVNVILIAFAIVFGQLWKLQFMREN